MDQCDYSLQQFLHRSTDKYLCRLVTYAASSEDDRLIFLSDPDKELLFCKSNAGLCNGTIRIVTVKKPRDRSSSTYWILAPSETLLPIASGKTRTFYIDKQIVITINDVYKIL